MQCRGGTIASDGMFRADLFRKSMLKLLDLWTAGQKVGAKNVNDSGDVFFGDRLFAVGNQCEVGDVWGVVCCRMELIDAGRKERRELKPEKRRLEGSEFRTSARTQY